MTQAKRTAQKEDPVVVGIDLGSRRDHTGIIVLELEQRLKQGEAERVGFDAENAELTAQLLHGGSYRGQAVEKERHFIARYVKRLPLGVSYPQVVAHVKRLDDQLYAKFTADGPTRNRSVTYVVDGTGLGEPVVSYLRQDIEATRVKAVYITAGQEARVESHELRIPKYQLVSMLQVLLQTGRVHLPTTSDAEAMRTELTNYELKVHSPESPEMGALRTGQHDDLVTALGLAVYFAEKQIQRTPLAPPVIVGRGLGRWTGGGFGYGSGLRRLRGL